MMKKALLCYVLVFSVCLSLAACAPSGSPAVSTSSGSSAAQGLSPEESAVAGASTVDLLQPLLKQYYNDKKYPMAMLAAEKILTLDPSNDDAYAMKANLWILIMKDANDSLNSMLAQDIKKVSDPAAYKEQILQIYKDAGFQLTMPFIADNASPDEINTVGNTAENLFTAIWKPGVWEWWNGVFATQGEWIYYFNYNDNFSLYKMRLNGENRQQVCGDTACCLNVIGDWIYFCNASDKNTLYKIRTDGSMKTKIGEDRCEYVCVSGDYIYYCNADENGKMYRIRTDGTAREPFGEEAQYIFIKDGYLYYTSRDEQTLARVSLDGSGRQVLIKGQWNIRAQIQDVWIYYLANINGMAVMKMRMDGSEQTEIWRYDAKINSFILAKNRLVVSVRTADKGEKIMAFDLDTMKQILVLDNASSEALCTTGRGDVYFSNNMDNHAWYAIDWEKGTAVKME